MTFMFLLTQYEFAQSNGPINMLSSFIEFGYDLVQDRLNVFQNLGYASSVASHDTRFSDIRQNVVQFAFISCPSFHYVVSDFLLPSFHDFFSGDFLVIVCICNASIQIISARYLCFCINIHCARNMTFIYYLTNYRLQQICSCK